MSLLQLGSKLHRSPLGRLIPSSLELLLRDMTGAAPIFAAPGSVGCHRTDFVESVSDAFVWRCDDVFRTRFDLMNLPTLITPSDPVQDRVTVIYFNAMGKEIERITTTLEPFEMQPIFAEDVVGENAGIGTFCVFHESEHGVKQWPYKTCLSERSYVSYQGRDGSNLWSYVHGCCNTYVLAYDFLNDTYRHLCRKAWKTQLYSPQLRFDDCERFEVSYTNPLTSNTQIVVKAMNDAGQIVTEKTKMFGPLETFAFEFENPSRACVTVSHESQVFAWRPLVFKYYETHFDVLHS